MHVDLEKIKKLPPDVRKDFYKMYLKYGEKKQQCQHLRLLSMTQSLVLNVFKIIP